MGDISKNFSLSEFEYSDTARQRGIDNTIPEEAKANIQSLVEDIVQPIRDAYGKPIRVTSGYRCAELNTAVGGSATSAHTQGLACDLVPQDGDTAGFIDFAISFISRARIPFDQLIDEHSRDGKHWLHVGYKSQNGAQRGIILTGYEKR